MSPADLSAAGRFLHGSDWVPTLAEELGVDPDLVRCWAAGQAAIPAAFEAALHDRLSLRHRKIGQLLGRMAAGRAQTSFGGVTLLGGLVLLVGPGYPPPRRVGETWRVFVLRDYGARHGTDSGDAPDGYAVVDFDDGFLRRFRPDGGADGPDAWVRAAVEELPYAVVERIRRALDAHISDGLQHVAVDADGGVAGVR